MRDRDIEMVGHRNSENEMTLTHGKRSRMIRNPFAKEDSGFSFLCFMVLFAVI